MEAAHEIPDLTCGSQIKIMWLIHYSIHTDHVEIGQDWMGH